MFASLDGEMYQSIAPPPHIITGTHRRAHARTFTHVHAYTHKHTHTHTHTHTRARARARTQTHAIHSQSNTLRVSLSGSFLQTLPDMVTPLKGHSIFISVQLSTDAVSALRKVWVLIIMTVANVHRFPPSNKSSVSQARICLH